MNEIVSEGGNETVLPPIVADINWQTGETEDVSNARCRSNPLVTMVSDGYSQFFRSNVFGPSGFWTMAPLRYTGKFDPFLSLDCAPTPSTLVQSKERKGSNFAIWQPCLWLWENRSHLWQKIPLRVVIQFSWMMAQSGPIIMIAIIIRVLWRLFLWHLYLWQFYPTSNDKKSNAEC